VYDSGLRAHRANPASTEAMGVSRSGFHAWLNRSPSARSRSDEAVGQQVKASFLAGDRTYGARRIWRDLLADGVECGLHRIERLMRLQALRARPRRRRLPKDEGDRQVANVPSNLLHRQFEAEPAEPEVDRRLLPTSGPPRAGSTCRP